MFGKEYLEWKESNSLDFREGYLRKLQTTKHETPVTDPFNRGFIAGIDYSQHAFKLLLT